MDEVERVYDRYDLELPLADFRAAVDQATDKLAETVDHDAVATLVAKDIRSFEPTTRIPDIEAADDTVRFRGRLTSFGTPKQFPVDWIPVDAYIPVQVADETGRVSAIIPVQPDDDRLYNSLESRLGSTFRIEGHPGRFESEIYVFVTDIAVDEPLDVDVAPRTDSTTSDERRTASTATSRSTTSESTTSHDRPPADSAQHLDDIDPDEFEDLVAAIWSELGYDADATPRSRDRGIDVVAERTLPTSERVLIQAKAYSPSNKITSRDVRQYATLYQQDETADQVVLVTTSTFTTDATALADDLNVRTVDRSELERLLDEAGLAPWAQNPGYGSGGMTRDGVRTTNSADNARASRSRGHDTPSKPVVPAELAQWEPISGLAPTIDPSAYKDRQPYADESDAAVAAREPDQQPPDVAAGSNESTSDSEPWPTPSDTDEGDESELTIRTDTTVVIFVSGAVFVWIHNLVFDGYNLRGDLVTPEMAYPLWAVIGIIFLWTLRRAYWLLRSVGGAEGS